MTGKADSVHELESVNRDYDGDVEDNENDDSRSEENQFRNKKVEVIEEPKVNDTFEESPPDTSIVSMVEEKVGQEIKDNVEDDNAGSKVHRNNDNLASSLPDSDEEGNKMEVEMKVEVPKGNETSQVFPPDNLKGSRLKEKGGKKSRTM
eukprot:14632169-Ditylum_brightwellii.AAC.1